jgi:hypothetical protein
VKEYIVVADIASKRDRYAEMVMRKVLSIRPGNPGLGTSDRSVLELHVVYLKHEEGMRYEEMEDSFLRLITHSDLMNNCDQLVDGTGVGDAVVERLRSRGAFPVSVIFTSGGAENAIYEEVGRVFGSERAGDLAPMRMVKEWRVPKRNLVAAGSLFLEQKRIKIARNIPFADALRSQLEGFRGTLNEPNKRQKFEAETENLHDDFVVDFLMACWWANRGRDELPEREMVEAAESNTSWDPLERANLKAEPEVDSNQMSVQPWR